MECINVKMSMPLFLTHRSCLGAFYANRPSTGLRFESPPRRIVLLHLANKNTKFGVGMMAKAVEGEKRAHNTEGHFSVDSRCIECGACCWMAPRTFKRIDGQYAVYNQPSCAEERWEALQAVISCPTASIHTTISLADILQVQMSFPLQINEKSLPGVYHCGYHSDQSNGATSYLITHPKGNILVDSPRYTECLAHNIEGLGGVRYMLLTHSASLADHAIWAKRLRCDRIMHIYEVDITTSDIELMLEGQGPWSIFSDFDIIFTPGHTKGSVSLFYKPLKALFTGDCFTVSTNNRLDILDRYNRNSVIQQLDCIQRFLKIDFLWILPGHGGRIEFKDLKEKNGTLEKLLASGN